jgi:predicted transcriptional regulator
MPWLSAHRDDPLFTDISNQAALDLTAGPASRLPGFLAPTPVSPLTGIDEELDEVRRTPADVVCRDLRGSFGSGTPPSLLPMLTAPRSELAKTVDDLARYWQRTLAPTWPRMRALLESDIHHRARTLTERGPAAMFGDIHHDLHFDAAAGNLTIANRHAEIPDPHRSLDGRGLVLVPSAFTWPHVWVKTTTPWIPVIRYPVRGVGTLWESTPVHTDLAAVLGATRARLLRLLETPASTQELARRTGLAEGGVSAHLHKLTAAGLTTPNRVGRTVLYARTPKGKAIVA